MKQFNIFGDEFVSNNDNKYTKSVKLPIYEPKNKCPHILELVDKSKSLKNLDKLFKNTVEFYKKSNAVSIAFSQGGDFIGGIDNGKEIFRFNKRKAMNTFFCSIKRKFVFSGKLNEDVNTYTNFQSRGNLFLTICNASITQKATQKNAGGMTDIYIENGTYVKSFYSIICSPSCVKIKQMNSTNKRLHHSIKWENAVPAIINRKHKKN